MKALSLWQPWATAVAIGVKQYETRHWPAPTWLLGQRIAIHAAKRRHGDDEACLVRILNECAKSREIFSKHYSAGYRSLPFGAVVCTAILKDCLETDYLRTTIPEWRWGNFDDGRYAWELIDVVRLEQPVPCIGRQGIFVWNQSESGSPAIVQPGELNLAPPK